MAKFKEAYSIHEELGRGSFAIVHKCTQKETKKTFAVKVVDTTKAKPSQLEDLKSEVQIMQELTHNHIVNVADFMPAPQAMYIVMEYVKGGDLFKVVSKLNSYSENAAAHITLNFLKAMEYINNAGVAHRDLKPDNMLLVDPMPQQKSDMDKNLSAVSNIKVADFGFATKCGDEHNMTKCCGTPYYIAPEILNCGLYKTGAPYGKECDMWSVGVIVYVLLSGMPPFQAKERNALFKKIVKGKFAFPTGTAWDRVSDGAKDFIRQCIVVDPKKRYTATKALQHPWILNAAKHSKANLPRVQKALTNFNGKHKFKGAVFGVEALHRMLYLKKCVELGKRPNSGVVAAFENQKDQEAEEMNLANNYIGKKGVEPVMAAVQNKTKLKKLSLKNNELENNSLDTICKALERHPSITHIDLSGNPLTRGAAKKLMTLVQTNPNIQRVDLDGTQIHPNKLKTLDIVLHCNRARSSGETTA